MARYRFRIAPDNPNIPFMRGRFMGLALSAFLSLASIVLFFHPGLHYGIDFVGGVVIQIETPEKADFESLRTDLNALGYGEVRLQAFGSDKDVLIRLTRQPTDAAQKQAIDTIRQTLTTKQPGTKIQSTESVGGAVSAELAENAFLALLLAMLAMLLYIWFRFEWQFGVGAVATLVLDVTKTVGFYAITGFEFNLTAVAAVLTIMGYSVNDKVVVYDRVRENLRLYKQMPLKELIDRSINETLARTLSTSVAIFLATLPLAIFAGENLREFAWTLLFGVVLATSSSIFIAAPILLLLGEKKLRRQIDAPKGGSKPSAREAKA